MLKLCYNYESGQYEYLEKDGFSVERGEYVLLWDDSEYRREEQEQQEFRFAEDDEYAD